MARGQGDGAGGEPGAVRAMTGRERLVLSLLRRDGAMSRSALIRASELSGTAMFRVTEDLAARGFIRLGAPVREGRGQPSNLVELSPRRALALGLSVMTDAAEAVVIDLAGEIVARRDVARSGMGRAAILDAAAAFAREVAGAGEAVSAAGLAVAGFFTGEPHQLNPASDLDDWALVDLKAEAQARFGFDVTVENLANAAAVGEALLGAGQGYASFAYVSVASGFGGGFVLNGKPWRGAYGNAGEFAALLKHAGVAPPTLETLRATLAEHGVETSGIADLVARYDPTWPGLDLWITDVAPRFRLLAHLIHYCADVEAVLIGGRAPRDLAERIAAASQIDPKERAARARRGVAHPDPVIRAATTGSSSAALGAAAIPLSATFFTSLAHLSAMA